MTGLHGRKATAWLGVLVVAGCGTLIVESACLPSGRPCSPGDDIPCSCADGRAGAQVCDNQGSAYGACDCTLLDAGQDALAMTSDDAEATADAAEVGVVDGGLCSGGTNLPITCPCTLSSQCADNNCFSFNAKGPHCTKPCTSAMDCAPLSTKCNMMGVCGPP
jgi:hypothetical protein